MNPMIGYSLAVLFVLVGFAGLLLPAVPGVPMVFAGLLLAAWAGSFAQVGPLTIVVLAVLTLCATLIDLLASALGTRWVGATRWAFVGAALGAIVGLFFGLVGLVLGPLIGAMCGEWMAVRDVRQAARAGGAATLGLVIAAAAKIGIVFTMLGVFALSWWI
jgi:uncharacterized protein